jgi:hypothetical protein
MGSRTALIVLGVVLALLSFSDIIPSDRENHLSAQEKAFWAEQKEIEERIERNSRMPESPDVVRPVSNSGRVSSEPRRGSSE